jgi:hypothetical protein
MALKYWYVASNGSANWSVAGNWYNGSGGTGGVAGVPTTADDAIVDSASGSGTLTIGGTSTCNSLNTLTFTGTFAGTSALNIVTSSVVSNGQYVLQLGGNHTYSGTITFTSTISEAIATLYMNCNGIFHKGNMTFNTSTSYWEGWNGITDYEPIRLTGTLLLTSGSIFSVYLYAGNISTSNSNVRSFQFGGLYLSGVGTLILATTQTNLNWTISFGIYVTNTTATTKAITFSSNVYSSNLYIEGSGASNTTIAVAATTGVYPDIYISKTDGNLFFNTTYVNNLTFVEGTTVTWGSTSNIFIYGNVTMCNSVINAATTNPLTFAGTGIQIFTTFNKLFNGALTVNDGGSFTNNLQIIGNYISSDSGTAISITSTQLVEFTGSVLLNNGSISINGTGGSSQVSFKTITLVLSLTITQSNVDLGSSDSGSTVAANLTVNSGSLTINENSTINTSSFISSSTTLIRNINLGTNTVINLTNTTGTIWNTGSGISTGVLFFNAGTSTVNITDTTGGTVNFLGGGITLYDLNIRRGVLVSNNPTTTFTGSQTYRNFKDLTTLQPTFIHFIQFGSSSVTSIYDTFQVGNLVNLTYLVSSSASVYFNVTKLNPGLVICPNVNVQLSNATPSNTWYAISGSVNSGTTGWIFNNIPRRLGSLGAG